MKRSLLLFVTILTILSLVIGGCTTAVPEDVPIEGTTFMWEVTAREGDGKIYLLGSIHTGRDDLYPLNPIITDAFEASEILAIECDVTTIYQRPDYLQLMEKVMYTDGTTVKDHIPEALYEETSALLEDKGFSIQLFSLYKPFILASNISNLLMEEWGYSTDKGIDVHFINLAREKGMEIVELESVEFQYDMLGGFSDELQILQLEGTLKEIETSKQIFDDMFNYWVAGDIEGFEELIFQDESSSTPEEKELYREYEKQMFDDRNINMAAKAEAYIKTGKTIFLVVGSGHMVGDTGIVKLLRDRGYEVIQK